MKKSKWFCILFILVLINMTGVGCVQAVEVKHITIPAGNRDQLTVEQLMADRNAGEAPIHLNYFMPMGESTPPLLALEGTLTVPEFTMKYIKDPNILSSWTNSMGIFPAFSVQFFTYQDYLIPVNQGIIPSIEGESYWSIILSPGKVWSEPGDGGLSRASFPFVLVTWSSGEAHNGIATFLYDKSQVSSFHFQISQETAAWNKTDYWGQAPMKYLPGKVMNQASLKEPFINQITGQFPILSWSELEKKINEKQLNTFNGGLPSEEISSAGVILDGTLYLEGCHTRYGDYPYCSFMRQGAFSVTKSMGAAIAMLRLAEKYGVQVFDLKIADYVTVTASHQGWDAVTFGDALNMATGVGDGPPDQGTGMMTVDDEIPKFFDFSNAKSAQEKLKIAFSYGKYPWGPGEVARYNSSTTFILSAAMEGFLKSKEGPEADTWDMVTKEVLQPIGIQDIPIMRTIEPDGSRGLPLYFIGLYPTSDDVAKVATLIQNGGQYQGQQLLHAGKLAEALRLTKNTGLTTGDLRQYGDTTYLMSFWADPYRTKDGRYLLIPYMSGYGGNRLILSPNGISSFRFTDSLNYDSYPLIRIAERLQSFPGPGMDVSQYILVKGIWLGPTYAGMYVTWDRLFLTWLILTLASLIFLNIDLSRGASTTWKLRLIWNLITVIYGILGLLVYFVAYRKQARQVGAEISLSSWKNALSLELILVIGNTIGIVLGGWFLNTYININRAGPILGMIAVFLCLYIPPLLVGLFLFHAPMRSFLSSLSYLNALGKSILPEFISTNMIILGILPTVLLLEASHLPFPNYPASLLFWIPVMAGVFVGTLTGYPLQVWMVHNGLAQGFFQSTVKKNSWWHIALVTLTSFILLIAVHLFTVVLLSS